MIRWASAEAKGRANETQRAWTTDNVITRNHRFPLTVLWYAACHMNVYKSRQRTSKLGQFIGAYAAVGIMIT